MSLPFVRTEMKSLGPAQAQGTRTGRRWAPGGRSPRLGLRRAEGAGEKWRRGTRGSEVTALFFLPAKSCSVADIPSRDELWYQSLLA